MQERPARLSPEPVKDDDEQPVFDEVYDLLWQAIEQHDVNIVRQLLHRFISIYPFLLTWQDKEGAMPRLVTVAARSGAVGVLEVFLEYHSCRESPSRSLHDDDDVRRPFFTTLNAACQAAQTGAVRYLLDLDPPQAEQRDETVRLLLNRGADATVVLKDDDQTVRATVLTMAMLSGSPRVIKWLVEAGASLDVKIERNSTLLHLGCQHHNAAAVRTLLDLGAASNLTTPDSGGRLPLHTAVDWVTFQQVKYVEHPSHKPICMPSIHETVALLLSDDKMRRATLNAKDVLGRTPLHLAAGSFRYIPVLRQLLDHGADPSIRSFDGDSLLHAILSSSTWQYSTESTFNYREREVHIDEALFRRLLRPPVPMHDTTTTTTTTNNTTNHPDVDLPDQADPITTTTTLVNEPDSQGNTPLHLAAAAWLERSIAILLHLGADPRARNHAGNTPAHLAAQIPVLPPLPPPPHNHITAGDDEDDDSILTEALAMQDRVMALLRLPPQTQTQTQSHQSEKDSTLTLTRGGGESGGGGGRVFVKARALREGAARELRRIDDDDDEEEEKEELPIEAGEMGVKHDSRHTTESRETIKNIS
ncbi:ankyrin repeat-containing domain protein [Chaetomium strumarium]|uniref:Ankyrin repeat-containing domain protein n=1 Tax=Chaetomium strumarium TaxID=1170767 RepID=A0AAJ0GPD0_9PEZI|nr:ankyrin repeat-containing domain protein [Chaetomium strumarium]